MGQICSKHGCSLSTLIRRAEENGWKRERSSNVVILDIGPVRVPEPPDPSDPNSPTNSLPSRQENSQWSRDDVMRVRRLTQSALIEHHHSSIARLRRLTDRMFDAVTMALDGEVVPPNLLSQRESTADLLEKLSRTLVRCIGLERQAYDLDVLSVNEDTPAEGTTESEVVVNEALEQLDSLAAEVYRRQEGTRK